MQLQHILVVCVGNICRSPMAEYWFKQNYPHLQVESAGISSLQGHPADEKAQFCMQRYGIDLKPHIAKQLSSEQVKKADLVLVMSQHQQKHLEQHWPFAKGKVFRLGHWRNQNIPDPYQKDQQVFEATCDLIKHCIADWKKYI